MNDKNTGSSFFNNRIIGISTLVFTALAYAVVLLIWGQENSEVLVLSVVPSLLSALFFGWIGGLISGGLLMVLNLCFIWLTNSAQDAYFFSLAIAGTSVNLLVFTLLGMVRNYSEKVRELKLKIETIESLDTITGVFNRRFAFSVINKLMEATRRYKESFVISYIDVDDLKSFNDEYNQMAGDQVLEKMIDVVTSNIRKSDYLCRLGGDEFILIFQKVDLETAQVLMSRIDEQMKRVTLHDKAIEISFGLAEFTDKLDCDVDSLIETADRRMYHHKSLKRFS